MKRLIIWSDTPDACVGLAAELRAGPPKRAVVIRDARYFQLGGVERCDALVFVDTLNADAIVAGYRAAERSIGRVGILEAIDGVVDPTSIDEPAAFVPMPAMAAAAFVSQDLLSERLAAMSDDALRTYVRGVTGVDPGEDATREAMEATLRGEPAPAKAAAGDDGVEGPEATPAGEEAPKRSRKGKGAAAQEG